MHIRANPSFEIVYLDEEAGEFSQPTGERSVLQLIREIQIQMWRYTGQEGNKV